MEDVIRRDSAGFRELADSLRDALSEIDRLDAEAKPSLCRERYYTSVELCTVFGISPRALQSYRDERIIPYTSIGGKILYPESGILALLETNMRK